MINAQLIGDNWVHVKWFTEWNFWNDFAELISTDYEILEDQKFSKHSLHLMIHNKRNTTPWYGIMFRHRKIKRCRYVPLY